MFAKRQAQKRPREMFCEKRCEGLKSCNFIEKRLQHRFFPVKFEKILRTLFLKNICEQLLLEAAISILWTEATIHMCSTYPEKKLKISMKTTTEDSSFGYGTDFVTELSCLFCLKKSANFTSLFFNKVADWRIATLFKKIPLRSDFMLILRNF